MCATLSQFFRDVVREKVNAWKKIAEPRATCRANVGAPRDQQKTVSNANCSLPHRRNSTTASTFARHVALGSAIRATLLFPRWCMAIAQTLMLTSNSICHVTHRHLNHASDFMKNFIDFDNNLSEIEASVSIFQNNCHNVLGFSHTSIVILEFPNDDFKDILKRNFQEWIEIREMLEES